MTELVPYAQQRRQVAVGLQGVELGLDQVAGVVLANVRAHEPDSWSWMPAGEVFAEVWTRGEPNKVKVEIQKAQSYPKSPSAGTVVVLQVHRATRWARLRAWWRWQVRAR